GFGLLADRICASSGYLKRDAPAGVQSLLAGCRARVARMTSPAPRHIPVLGREALEMLNPRDGGIYVDATFGAGGYSRAILEAANTQVIAIDRDQNAVAESSTLVRASNGRLAVVEERFSGLDHVAEKFGHRQVDGVVLDIGV